MTSASPTGMPASACPPPNLNGESWRSQVLQCETELRELVALGVQQPPSLKRTLKTMDLFDQFSDFLQAQPSTRFIGDALRLFRVELCRSIFVAEKDVDVAGDCEERVFATTRTRPEARAGSEQDKTGTPSGTPSLSCANGGLVRTYFEEAESLSRAKAFLEASLSNGTSSQSALFLQRQIEDKNEQISWYEAELERVRRQHVQVCEEYQRLKEKAEKESQDALATQHQLQREVQNLRLENKDVQLQLFRLRKQMAGGKSNQLKEGYRNLKLSKILQTQSLFDEGDERVALLVLLGQVESRVNEVLDAYDNDFVLTPEAAQRQLKKAMAESVVVLLEDMHYCESAYRRLVQENRAGEKRGRSTAADNIPAPSGIQRIPLELVHSGSAQEAPDATDGFVAILFDQRVYEHFQVRHGALRRLQQFEANRSGYPEQATTAESVASSGRVSSMDADSPLSPHTIRKAMKARRADSVDRKPSQAPAHVGAGESRSRQQPAIESPQNQARIGEAYSKNSDVARSTIDLQSGALGVPSRRTQTTESKFFATQNMASPDREGHASRAQWVSNILGASTTSLAFTIPRPYSDETGVCVVERKIPEVLPAETVMQRVLRHPMQDLSSERFLSTIELFTGEDPVQQKLLCRVNYVDPSLPIQVPEATNFVKIKYAHAENASVAAAASPGEEPSSGSQSASASRSGEGDENSGVFAGNPQLRLFSEFENRNLVEKNAGLQYRAGAVNSTTASTVAFQRLQPLSPDRGPEWLLYQQLFGGYRSLTPRMIEVTTIDHLMACASERFFIRMEYRYDECLARAAQQCASVQLQQDMALRLFKDMYVLSDFQEALVDELESRYGYPELVAKTLYEILCYLDALAEKDNVLASYLDVIRGFSSPTQVHYISYMLYHLSYCWPSADPTAPVTAEEVRMVFDYLYRNATALVLVDSDSFMKEYDMATRSAPLTFVSVRAFLASSMAHMEELLLILLQSRFHIFTKAQSTDEVSWEAYDEVIAKCGHMKEEQRSLVRFFASGLGVNRPSVASLQQLTFLAASAWCSNLWQ
ncbi:hypothetical protein JKF63_01292 [Porcisia hertigi]|uniref:Uncharacterized protein n=1 Tax=Porcisia hertigi TaxID=2761500 RepID=A0A836L0H9_9TRYP|nr:hypothetical protein JKF63_01292 [Porcisia hertigi]